MLVTGAAGFIGSHVAEHLVKAGHEVVGIDDFSGGFKSNVPEGCKVWSRSITDEGFVERLFQCEKFDYVFHLAAYAAEGLSHFIKRFNYTNNVIGSVNLINAAVNHGVKGFIYTSSIAVYGHIRAASPALEIDPPRPIDSYGIAKYAVEQELFATQGMFGLDYIIFRPHNVYGERQNIGDRYRNVVGIFINQCLKGEPLPIFGDGQQIRSFSYVGDVAPVIAESWCVTNACDQIFNLGSDHLCTIEGLARLVCAHMGVPYSVKHYPARNEAFCPTANHKKARRVFGIEHETKLTVGIERMCAWAKKHGARESKPFEQIEIRKNLPESWRT